MKVQETPSLVKRLTLLYMFSTLGLLLVIALLFFPSIARILSHFNAHDYKQLTVECIKQVIIMLLFVSVSGMLIGHSIARKGLRKIEELEQTMARISVNALNERLCIQDWPRELKPLGEQFNDMLGRLHQAFKQLEQFSSDLAHELRHPLHHLQHMTERALSKDDLTATEQDLLVMYMREFKMLSTLVEQLLFIARQEQSQIPLHKEWINLYDFMHHIMTYYEAWAEEKDITLTCSGEARLYADASLLQRAVNNVLANALQYTKHGGHINIHLTSSMHEGIQISITDDGIGIDDEHLAKLFQRCYRVDHSRSQYGSLGLGLSIVKSIMELHHARVSIKSQRDHGTTVVMTFSDEKELSI
jgi:two-component system heavy metal sensor histidine kinase CusS